MIYYLVTGLVTGLAYYFGYSNGFHEAFELVRNVRDKEQ